MSQIENRKKPSTILVTGACGFIGSYLVKDLVISGHKPVIVVRPSSDISSLQGMDVSFRNGDITNLRSMVDACEGIDTVIHLAALTSSGGGSNRENSFQTNVVGCQNVIDACRLSGVQKVIYVGTQSDNEGSYATNKRYAEKLLRESELNVTIIKPSLVYGPGGKGLFGSMVKFIDRFPILPIIGSGKYPMKPIYVGDVTQTILNCINSDCLEDEYLISGPNEVSYAQYLNYIARAKGFKRMEIRVPYFMVQIGISLISGVWKECPITIDTLKGLVNPKVHGSEAAEKGLNFHPLALEQGLQLSFAPNAASNNCGSVDLANR